MPEQDENGLAASEADIEVILKQVESWPAAVKRRLGERLVESAQPEIPPGPAGPVPLGQRPSLGSLIGIANPTGKTYTDEDVERLRQEALAEKYLRR